MVAIGTYEAKTHLAQLLDRVEQGETFVITRHGVPIARLVPVQAESPSSSSSSVQEAIDGLRRLRAEVRPAAPGDPTIREMIQQGRRY